MYRSIGVGEAADPDFLVGQQQADNLLRCMASNQSHRG